MSSLEPAPDLEPEIEPDPGPETAIPPRPELATRALVIRTAIPALVVFLGYALLFVLFRHQLADFGRWFGRNFGFLGVFVYVYLVDTFIVPATVDVVFSFTQEWQPLPLLVTMSAGSILGGWSGFEIGRRLNHLPFVQSVTRSYRARGESLIRRYGVWAIVIAGLTPVPYSTVSWIAGMLRLDARLYILGSLSRAPRLVIYYLLVRGGYLLFA